MGEIFIIFYIFSDICYFLHMKNKIGILENDNIYISHIVNSVILLGVNYYTAAEAVYNAVYNTIAYHWILASPASPAPVSVAIM